MSNAGPSGQSTAAFVDIKNKAKTVETSLPVSPQAVEDRIVSNFKKSTPMAVKFNEISRRR